MMVSDFWPDTRIIWRASKLLLSRTDTAVNLMQLLVYTSEGLYSTEMVFINDPRAFLPKGVKNWWNRWSENQSINRWQSMPVNRLISIIDKKSMFKFYVIIDFIDYHFLSIINTNRSVNLHRLSSIGCHFLCVLLSVKISKTRSLYASNNDENCNNTLIFSRLIHRGEHGHRIL